MTVEAVKALHADHEALIELAATFSTADWAAPSACDGWTVRDLVAHLTQLFRQVVDPAGLPPADPSGATERTQDRWVEAMRDRSPEEVLREYVELGGQALLALEGLQGNDTPIDLGDLGTHPLHLVANAFAFDHYTHIRADLLAPLGPLDRPAPPSDEAQLAPAIDWMIAGIPQMCAGAMAALDNVVRLELTGPGGRTVLLGTPGGGGPEARVASSTADFVLWATRRRNWRDLDVEASGDEDLAARFCDAIHIT